MQVGEKFIESSDETPSSLDEILTSVTLWWLRSVSSRRRRSAAPGFHLARHRYKYLRRIDRYLLKALGSLGDSNRVSCFVRLD